MRGSAIAALYTRLVALTRSGFIAPTARAGGDALPLHDTDGQQVIEWTFSPVTPPRRTFDRRQRETVVLGRLGPIERVAELDLTQSPSPFIEPSSLIRRFRWLPWSLLLAVGGLAAVYLAAVVAGLSGSPVATAAVASVLLCGVLLIVAQLLDGRTR